VNISSTTNLDPSFPFIDSIHAVSEKKRRESYFQLLIDLPSCTTIGELLTNWEIMCALRAPSSSLCPEA
jgi:hypothetical protein